MIGEFVVVRTYSAGVHVGTLAKRMGQPCYSKMLAACGDGAGPTRYMK